MKGTHYDELDLPPFLVSRDNNTVVRKSSACPSTRVVNTAQCVVCTPRCQRIVRLTLDPALWGEGRVSGFSSAGFTQTLNLNEGRFLPSLNGDREGQSTVAILA